MKYAAKGPLILAATFAMTTLAHARIEALSIRFGGGCRPENTNGACVIRVLGSGTNLEREGIILRHAGSPEGPFLPITPRERFLSDSGRATLRFRNVQGCYQVTTRSGSVRSNVLCEAVLDDDDRPIGTPGDRDEDDRDEGVLGDVSATPGSPDVFEINRD